MHFLIFIAVLFAIALTLVGWMRCNPVAVVMMALILAPVGFVIGQYMAGGLCCGQNAGMAGFLGLIIGFCVAILPPGYMADRH
jgi:hypothetical protein